MCICVRLRLLYFTSDIIYCCLYYLVHQFLIELYADLGVNPLRLHSTAYAIDITYARRRNFALDRDAVHRM